MRKKMIQVNSPFNFEFFDLFILKHGKFKSKTKQKYHEKE